MKLYDILKGLDYELLSGDIDINISDIAYDSRKVKSGSMFICRKGPISDGHEYIKSAIESGAVAIMIENVNAVANTVTGVTYIKVPNSRYALAKTSDNFYEHTSGKMNITGITGTAGKTTVTYMVKSIYEQAGIKSGLIGTIQNMAGNEILYSNNTTPESYDLQLLFAKMLDVNIDNCVMEVSSQGLYLNRVDCVDYEVGVFTNLSHDHIGPDEHSSMEDYANQKAKLFNMCKKGLFNIDSEYAEHMMKNASCEKYTFGIENKADFFAKNIINTMNGVTFTLDCKYGTADIELSTAGKFSVYNALAAIGASLLSGKVTLEQAKDGVKNVKVPGRAEQLETRGDYSIMIDFAHNPESFKNIITLVREYAKGRIVFLFGCGGDKERPRELMGEVAGEYADFSIITSDNPRTEDPLSIILDIEEGIKKTKGKYISIVDRREAIKYAIKNAQPKDVIILAGKGHETYQIFKDKTIHFDEREVVTEIMEELRTEKLQEVCK